MFELSWTTPLNDQRQTALVALELERYNIDVCCLQETRFPRDVMSWPTVLGHHGKGACDSNGELLLSFCAEQQMTVSNTLFQMPDKWFYSWQHPRSKRYHLLDYVLVRQSDIQDI